jgi:peptidoglycan/xylan/chitin deacetylase (PgdA/CDA1 family)
MKGGPLTGITRRIVFGALWLTGIPWLLRHTIQRHRPTVVLFHAPGADRFARLAAALRRRYSFITLADLVEWLDSGGTTTLPARPALVTFDDGHASNAELVATLRREGIRPVVFVCTRIAGTGRGFWWSGLPADDVERLKREPDPERLSHLRAMGRDPEEALDRPQALDMDQIRMLRTVADLESHTRTHPVLTSCSPERVREEVEGSVEDLERMLGTTPIAFAYPNGDHSPEVERIVAESGLRFGFTTEPRSIEPDEDAYRLPRFFVRDDATAPELVVFASGLKGLLSRLLRPSR